MKRRQGPIHGRYTDRYSATLVWRSSRAWHPHFRRVPPANATTVSRWNQFLAQDAGQLIRQKVHTMLLGPGRKKIQIALHRVGNLLRMQGRNNEMSGLRSLQGRQCGFVIPDLTDENDIRRLTKCTPQPDRKGAGVASDLSLGEMTALASELILDGILDRHYVSHQVLVHPLKKGRDGGGFP